MNPRDYALKELDAKNLPHWPPRALKQGNLYKPPNDPRDHALAENIIIGVTKNLLLLQHLIQYYSDRNLKSLDLVVQKILAIGLYQLRFLDRVPPSAAVDQAVEQTRRFGESRASGFVNAVLRKATRDPNTPLPARDNPAEYCRIVLSHPPELFLKLEKLLGTERAILFCEHNQQEPPTIIRLSAQREIGEAALMAGASETLQITPHEQPHMFVVTGAKRSTFADWSAQGIAQVQDPTAAAVVSHLDLHPKQTIVDRCCGLGTKTLQVRDAIGDTGQIVAIDPSDARCQGLVRLLNLRKIQNITVHRASFLKDLSNISPEYFDRALVDVPCSNSGVLARRPEARYAQTPRNLESLGNLQDEILADTAPYIKPTGLLLYSTCSIWPEENEHRIDAFVRKHPNFEIMHTQTTLPSGLGPQFDSAHRGQAGRLNDPTSYHDGGFIALLRRI